MYQNSGWINVLFKKTGKTWNIKTNSSEEEKNFSVYKHEKGKDGISLHENKKLAIKNLKAQKNCTFISEIWMGKSQEKREMFTN